MKLFPNVVKFLLLGLLAVTLYGCSGSSGTANANTVDATTQVPAGNIILDNSKTTLASKNIQGAMEELAPSISLSQVLVGTWNIKQYSDVTYSGTKTGTIVFQTSTYTISGTDSKGNAWSVSGTWSIEDNTVLHMTTPTSGGGAPLYPVKLSTARIDLMDGTNMISLKK